MPDDKRPPLADIVVGDRFWLAYAQEVVRGAVKAPEERATQLTAAIAWFWTVYSAAGVLAVAFGSDRLGTPAAALIALPSLILIVAYWQASRVGRPLLFTFDPRVPAEVSSAYAEAAKQKQEALRVAERWTALAGVCVAVGLAAAFALPSPASTSLTARFDPRDPGRLLVLAEVPRHAAVTFEAFAASPPDCAASAVTALERSGPDGLARASLRVGASAQRVSVSWVDDKEKVTRSLSVDVKPGE